MIALTHRAALPREPRPLRQILVQLSGTATFGHSSLPPSCRMHDAAIGRTDILLQSAAPVSVQRLGAHKDGRQ